MEKWITIEEEYSQVIRSIIPKIVKLKVLLLVTAWKATHAPLSARKTFVSACITCTDHPATSHSLIKAKIAIY